MNLEIEDLKKHLQRVKHGYLKAQKYSAAAVLRDMEWILDRIDSLDEDEPVNERLEELKRKLKNA